MKAITLTLNGKRLAAAVEPRTHLADFLRETQGLTGTQGVLLPPQNVDDLMLRQDVVEVAQRNTGRHGYRAPWAAAACGDGA